MPEALLKSALFHELGYADHHPELEDFLEAEGLSRPGKDRISAKKREAVREALELWAVRVCNNGDCQREAQELDDGRLAVTAMTRSDCDLCGGSANAQAVAAMIEAMAKAGFNRLCVVGGSSSARSTLRDLCGGQLSLNLVDGTVARTRKQAKADMEGADLTAVWGATELDHKVSSHYKGPNVILFAKRSIQALAQNVTESIYRHHLPRPR